MREQISFVHKSKVWSYQVCQKSTNYETQFEPSSCFGPWTRDHSETATRIGVVCFQTTVNLLQKHPLCGQWCGNEKLHFKSLG